MSSVIFQGNYLKGLKGKLKLGTSATDTWLDNLSADPTVTAVSAPAGSIGFYNGTVYLKQDAGSTTAWKAVTKLPGVLFYDHAEFGLISKFTTGKNSTTFLSGGALGGALTRSTTAGDLIEGTAVYKYVANATPANSVGDYIADAAWTVPLGRRGVENYTMGTYSWTGAAAEAYFVAYDPTTGNTIQWELETTGSSGSREFSFPWTIASSSTTMRYGFWIKALATGSSTLKWSPITHNTGTSANRISNVPILASAGYNSFATSSDKLVLTLTSKHYSGVGTLENYLSCSGTGTFTVLQKCRMAISYMNLNTTGTNQARIHVNGLASPNAADQGAASEWCTANYTWDANAGDTFTLNHNIAPTTIYAAFVVTQYQESLIIPSKVWSPMSVTRSSAQSIPDSTITKIQWNSVTSDTDSHFDSTNYRWVSKGTGTIDVMAQMQLNTTSSTGYREVMIYKNGSHIRSKLLPQTSTVQVSVDVQVLGVSVSVGDYIEIYVYQNTGGAVNTQTTTQYVYFEVKWNNSYPSVTQPISRIATLKHINTSGNGGGTATATTNNFPIGTTAQFVWSGDISFIRVDTATNSWYMPPGTYRIRKNEHAFYKVDNCSAHVYNINTTTRYAKTIVMESSSAGTQTVIATGGSDEFTTSAENQFNWRYVIDTTRATDGLGNPNGDGTNELFGVLEIEKVR